MENPFEGCLEIIEKFKGKKILVIGDAMLDEYVYGKVERISPEAPVPVVNYQLEEVRLGGAANVCLNLVSLGANCSLATTIGNDINGGKLIALLNESNISTDLVIKIEDRITTSKQRIIANKHQLLRIDSEINFPINPDQEQLFLSKILPCIIQFDCIIFEDYDKGCITPLIINQVVEEANKFNIPTAVDPKKRNFLMYKNVTLFKPNLKELIEGLEINPATINALEDYKKYSMELMQILESKGVMVTLSEKGAIIHAENDFYYTPAHIRNISDVSGAGDTVISVASLCLASVANWKQVLEISNLAGGMVCEKLGVVPLSIEELKQEILSKWD